MQNSSTAALASRQCRELAKSTEHEALPRRVGTSHASPRAISCKDKFWERHPAAKPQQENGVLSRKQHTANVCPTVQLLLCGQRSNGGYSQSKRFSQMFLRDIAVTRCSLCSPLLSGSCDVPKQDSVSHILTCLSNLSKRNPLPQSHPASAARKGGRRAGAGPNSCKRKLSLQPDLENILQQLRESYVMQHWLISACLRAAV